MFVLPRGGYVWYCSSNDPSCIVGWLRTVRVGLYAGTRGCIALEWSLPGKRGLTHLQIVAVRVFHGYL
jgi:hypothetical protein